MGFEALSTTRLAMPSRILVMASVKICALFWREDFEEEIIAL